MEEREVDETTIAAVRDAAKWIESTRDIGSLLRSDAQSADPVQMFLNFDIDSWCRTNDRRIKLIEFQNPNQYQTKIDGAEVAELIRRSRQTFGGDIYHWAPKMLEQHPVEKFWYRAAL